MHGKIECNANVKIMDISPLNSMCQLLNQKYKTKISDHCEYNQHFTAFVAF